MEDKKLVSECYLMDNMEYMATLPDKFFNLVLADPPYGLGDKLIIGGHKGSMGSLRKSFGSLHEKKWDNSIPQRTYFDELFRVSKNQIIWGGNYFLDYLGNTRCMIVWDKINGDNTLADAELAWTSFDKNVKIFRMHHFSSGYGKKIHPTQKPIKLYQFLLQNYAKAGDKIFDPNVGSGSSRIACDIMGFDFYGTELDAEYHQKAELRFNNHKAQMKLF